MFKKDEGRPFQNRLSRAGFKPEYVALIRTLVVSDALKVSSKRAKGDRKGTIDEVSKYSEDDVKTELLDQVRDRRGSLFTALA